MLFYISVSLSRQNHCNANQRITHSANLCICAQWAELRHANTQAHHRPIPKHTQTSAYVISVHNRVQACVRSFKPENRFVALIFIPLALRARVRDSDTVRKCAHETLPKPLQNEPAQPFQH